MGCSKTADVLAAGVHEGQVWECKGSEFMLLLDLFLAWLVQACT